MELWNCVAVAFIQCCLVVLVISKDNKDNVNIKIVEAPALSRFPSMPSHSHKVLTLRANPSPLSGPSHLQQLHNHCYDGKEKGYTYHVCLFNNITQKEDRTGWNSFYGVLGIWHEWIVENDTFVGMYYTMGDICSSSEREAKVMFNCSPSTRIHNITEPKTCSYHMIMDTPLACFKGAMQVYHMLSPKQLKQWDNLNHLYDAQEITYQGLTKRRKKVLIDAGLLQKEKKVTVTKAPNNSPHVPGAVSPSTISANLTRCIKEKESVESELSDLKSKLHKLMKDRPELSIPLRRILNISSPPTPSARTPAPANQNVQKDSPPRDVETLLSDEAMENLVKDLNMDSNGKGKVVHGKEIVRTKRELDNQELDNMIKDINMEELP